MFHKKEEKTENAGYPEGKKKRKKLPGWVILPMLGVIAAVFFCCFPADCGGGGRPAFRSICREGRYPSDLSHLGDGGE